jgi:Fe-S cluster biogenesis protein NfuA
MKCLLFFSLLLSVVFCSCNFYGERIRGNGDIKSETRSAKDFSAVSVSSNMELHVTQGTPYAVRIETDQNLMQYIDVRTNGHELQIGVKNNYNLDPSGKINVYVTAPEFKSLKASGACHLYSDGKLSSKDGVYFDVSGASEAKIDVNAPTIEVELSGASSINFKGETKTLRIDGSGASEVKCYDLMAETVDVDLSGACNAEVFASVKLKAGASGASNVHYKGAASVDQNTSGASSVQKAD